MTDTKERVAAVTTPETFNFVETVLDRSYPEFTVPVYLDEAAVQKMLTTNGERLELEERIAKMTNPGPEYAERLEKLQLAYENAVDTLKDKVYKVVVRGIAPEESIKIEALATEKYPIEYNESTSPITGQIIKNELPSDERDAEFATLLRQAHIVSVTNPEGAVDTDWSDAEKVRVLFTRLPLVARGKIDEAINACTIDVDFYRELVDEVF